MKLFIFALIALLTFCAQPQVATADTSFAMITDKNTAFFADASQQMQKCVLPFGYYVKVVSVGTEYSRVIYMDNSTEYPASYGYVLTANLKLNQTPTTTPYPEVTLTTRADDVIFATATLDAPLAVIQQNSTAVFYGELATPSQTLVYVYANGYIGYMRKSSFIDYALPPHPDSATLTATPPETPSPSTQTDLPQSHAQNTAQVALTFCIILVGLCLIYLALKPDRLKRNELSFFGEKDEF